MKSEAGLAVQRFVAFLVFGRQASHAAAVQLLRA